MIFCPSTLCALNNKLSSLTLYFLWLLRSLVILGLLLADQSVQAAGDAISIEQLSEIPRDEWPEILQNLEDYSVTSLNGAGSSDQDDIVSGGSSPPPYM